MLTKEPITQTKIDQARETAVAALAAASRHHAVRAAGRRAAAVPVLVGRIASLRSAGGVRMPNAATKGCRHGQGHQRASARLTANYATGAAHRRRIPPLRRAALAAAGGVTVDHVGLPGRLHLRAYRSSGNWHDHNEARQKYSGALYHLRPQQRRPAAAVRAAGSVRQDQERPGRVLGGHRTIYDTASAYAAALQGSRRAAELAGAPSGRQTMGITKKQLLAQCSPDTLQASAKARWPNWTAERTIVAEPGNTGALGVEVAPLAAKSVCWHCRHRRTPTGATGQNWRTRQPGGAGLRAGVRVEGAAPGHGADGGELALSSTCTVNARRATWTTSPRCWGCTERCGMARR